MVRRILGIRRPVAGLQSRPLRHTARKMRFRPYGNDFTRTDHRRGRRVLVREYRFIRRPRHQFHGGHRAKNQPSQRRREKAER